MRVAVVEDHPVTRRAICSAVAAEPDLLLVASVGSYDEARQLLASTALDLVLLDLQLGSKSALDLIAFCRERTDARVLVLSALGDEATVISAVRNGAAGYLLKDTSMTDLGAAIRQVGDGESPLTPAVARHLIRTLKSPTNQQQAGPLTARELQVLRALASGHTYKEVAAEFGLSYHTVVDYTRSLYRKLDVSSRTEAVVAGAQRGLITL